MKAWYFARDDFKSEHTRKPLSDEMSVSPPIELCKNGLHASERILDAFKYATGSILCRVELSGEILTGDDKVCAEHRKILAKADASKMLHEHALWCAEFALGFLDPEEIDPRIFTALDVKQRWLKGEATDRELSEARDAAHSAASSAARYAAYSAACYAAHYAAHSAAYYAAYSAARYAAHYAAHSAAYYAAYSAARYAAHSAAYSSAYYAAHSAARYAACYAAYSAARSAYSAARDAINDHLERRAFELLGCE